MVSVTDGYDGRIPYIKQLSCFIENRIGALQQIISLLEDDGIRICALSILDAADHGVVRLIVDRPTDAKIMLEAQGVTTFETNLLGVLLPADRVRGISSVLSTLLIAEVKVEYVYALITHPSDRPALAINVDDLNAAADALQQVGFDLVTQNQIWPDEWDA